MLESWEGSSQASCPALPNLGKAEPPLWPCPCQAGNPQQHQSLCCAGHWAHLNPVQAANRDSCLPSKLPAILWHYLQALGNPFALCTYGPAPSLLCPCPWKIFHSFPSQHLQALRKEPTKQCSNGTVSAQLNQESLCKIMSFFMQNASLSPGDVRMFFSPSEQEKSWFPRQELTLRATLQPQLSFIVDLKTVISLEMLTQTWLLLMMIRISHTLNRRDVGGCFNC